VYLTVAFGFKMAYMAITPHFWARLTFEPGKVRNIGLNAPGSPTYRPDIMLPDNLNLAYMAWPFVIEDNGEVGFFVLASESWDKLRAGKLFPGAESYVVEGWTKIATGVVTRLANPEIP